MSQATLFLFFIIFSATSSTFNAQVNQCEYSMLIHTGPTRGPTYKLGVQLEARFGGNINTTNLVKKWGDMGKRHRYFSPNSKDRFRTKGPCMNANFCVIVIRGKKGELNPHWFIYNITVTSKGAGIDRQRVWFLDNYRGTEVDYLYPYLIDGECP